MRDEIRATRQYLGKLWKVFREYGLTGAVEFEGAAFIESLVRGLSILETMGQPNSREERNKIRQERYEGILNPWLFTDVWTNRLL